MQDETHAANVSAAVLPDAATTPPPRVAIILVNYRGARDTLECLDSLTRLTYPERDVIVVDQNSGDGSAALIREQHPWAHLIENPVNDGFTGGNNAGMRLALARGADYLLLLNNDTVVDPGFLEPLVALAESDARIGVVGPQILYHGDPEIIWSSGGAVNWRGHSRLLHEGEPDAPGGEPREADFVTGCALMIKRAVLEKVGLLDERYFIYYEETDLCARVRAAGYRVLCEPRARIWHKVSRTFGQDSEFTLYYMRRNVLLYLGRHGQWKPLGSLAALCDSLRLAAVWTLQGKHRRRQILLRAVSDYLRGRLGKAGIAFS